MSLTLAETQNVAQQGDRDLMLKSLQHLKLKAWIGTIAASGTYTSGGDAFSLATKGITSIQHMIVFPREDSAYTIHWDYTNQKFRILAAASHTHTLTPLGAVGAHTHAVALDTGATGAEATHTHAVALDSGTSAAGSTHTHAFGTITGSGAATAAGDAHTHTWTAGGYELKYMAALTSADASASAQGTAENVDEAAACSAADDSWRAVSAVAAGAWTVGALGAHPPTPVACVIQIQNPTGGNLNLYEGVMTFTVTGTDPFGGAITEAITFTSSALNKEVVAAKFRWKYGLKAFKTITDVTLDNVPANDLTVCVGYSSKIFMGAIVPEASVMQVIEDGSSQSITGNVNATYGTFAHGALAASKVVSYLYKIASGATGTNANESTHTHAAGAITIAGSVADESAHTHGPGTLADAASGTGSSHTHDYGTLADAASGSTTPSFTGASTTTAAGSGDAEISAGTNIGSQTWEVIAIGY